MFFCLGCLNCNLHLLDYKLLQQKNQYFVKYYNCFFNNETILRLYIAMLPLHFFVIVYEIKI